MIPRPVCLGIGLLAFVAALAGRSRYPGQFGEVGQDVPRRNGVSTCRSSRVTIAAKVASGIGCEA